ncbi:MAG: DNA repair protein RecN, partial [Ruminococcaceae bacterium]|nr:DNA repair protein RecN [Oscillospiraceae bacterium]
DGTSRCRINQKPATVTSVREVCNNLINIHGQHDSQQMLNPENHIHILDNYANIEYLTEEYRKLYESNNSLKKELKNLLEDEEENRKASELLRYEIDEIEKANLDEDEYEELIEKRNILRNSERIINTLNSILRLLTDDENNRDILSLIYETAENFGDISRFSDEFEMLKQEIEENYYSLKDISDRVRNRLESFDLDSNFLVEVEERIDFINSLRRKYGNSIGDIFIYKEECESKLEKIENSDYQIKSLNGIINENNKTLYDKALEISEKRKTSAESMVEKVIAELKYLNMGGAIFEVIITPCEIGRNGMEQIEFYLSTNIGEPPKPFSKIASGGELARIMLAIKNVIAEKDPVDTLIFDEIDSGVSGKSAYKIGEKLKQSAKTHQTICVTHSAQISSFADNHLFISKQVKKDRTFTSVSRLDMEERKRELARIISGDSVTDISLKHADEMLINAEKYR